MPTDAFSSNLNHLISAFSPGHGNDVGAAFWIGATDTSYEGEFHWTDSLPFAYTSKSYLLLLYIIGHFHSPFEHSLSSTCVLLSFSPTTGIHSIMVHP